MPPEHYFLSCKHQGSTLINCYAEQFSKTLISILFKLPQFCPSVASVVSVMLSGYFHVSLNLSGISYFPILAEFRDTAPLNLKTLGQFFQVLMLPVCLQKSSKNYYG